MAIAIGFAFTNAALCPAQNLPGTQPLVQDGDLAAQMVAGIGRYLDRELDASVTARAGRWQADFSSREAYAVSYTHLTLPTNREV